MKCSKCGHIWRKRVKVPNRCPNCYAYVKYSLHIGLNSNSFFAPMHCLFADLDGRKINGKMISKLMQCYDMSNIQIWESSKNKYWITSFSPFSYYEILKIYGMLELDVNFIRCFVRNKYATLRVSTKNGFMPRIICKKNRKGGRVFYSSALKLFQQLIKNIGEQYEV